MRLRVRRLGIGAYLKEGTGTQTSLLSSLCSHKVSSFFHHLPYHDIFHYRTQNNQLNYKLQSWGQAHFPLPGGWLWYFNTLTARRNGRILRRLQNPRKLNPILYREPYPQLTWNQLSQSESLLIKDALAGLLSFCCPQRTWRHAAEIRGTLFLCGDPVSH